MIDLQKAEQETKDWLENFVESPNNELGGFAPCPYAKAARLKNKITFRLGVHPYKDLVHHAKQGNQGYEVFMYVYDADQWTSELFHELVYQANDDKLAQVDLISLPDHPKDPEGVNGLIFNQGTYAYSMVAPLEALNEASAKLHKAGYYEHWKDADTYMNGLFRGRKDPRV